MARKRKFVPKKFEWIVVCRNPEDGKLKAVNIFEHGTFLADCIDAACEYDERNGFFQAIKRSLLRNFWCVPEWEIYINASNEPGSFKCRVDAYDQVVLNWHIFCEYLWGKAAELQKEGEKS